MLSSIILDKISTGQINSRRQLYKAVGGRSKVLRLWLDQNDILVPIIWSKEKIIERLKATYNQTGNIPLASDCSFTKAVQNHFGSWNEGLYQALGVYNQKRYSHLSDIDLLNIIKDYIVKYQTIPSRDEFDGKKYPDYSTYYSRFNCKKWSEIIGIVDLSNIKLFHKKEKYGIRTFYEGNIYLSHKELLIGMWLTKNNILFDKEIPYGNSNFVFDFFIPSIDLYIEYYGIATDEYKDNINKKREKYEGRKVLEIFKHDNVIKKLSKEVQRL